MPIMMSWVSAPHCQPPSGACSTADNWLLQEEKRRGKHTLSPRTRCLLKLPHGKGRWDFPSHFISQTKSHGSAQVQGDGYWRLVVQSTTFSFCNKLGTWCVRILFFQTTFYKTWNAKLFSPLWWQINNFTWASVEGNRSVIKYQKCP